jgi:hypothetical protein
VENPLFKYIDDALNQHVANRRSEKILTNEEIVVLVVQDIKREQFYLDEAEAGR